MLPIETFIIHNSQYSYPKLILSIMEILTMATTFWYKDIGVKCHVMQKQLIPLFAAASNDMPCV